mgnify:CR=1 FL=1
MAFQTDWQRKRTAWKGHTTQWGDKWPKLPDPLYFSGAQQGYATKQFPFVTPAGRAKDGFAAPWQEFADPLKQPEPKGNYASNIDTRSPIDSGQMRSISNVYSQWSPPGAIASQALGYGSAGARSAGALGRGLSDLSKTALQRGTQQFGAQYRTEAEQARGEDIQSQRQNTMDRFKMDMSKAIFDADTWSRWQSEQSDIKAHYKRELANSNSIVTQAVIRGVMGLIGGFL